MHIFMVTLGTRGDLEPFAILGTELRERGHRVVIGTSAFYEAAVRKAGMEWTQVGNGTYDQLVAVLDGFHQIADRQARIDHYAARWLRPQFLMSEGRVRAHAEAADYFVNNLNLTYPRGSRCVPAAWLVFDPDELPRGPVERTPPEVQRIAVTNKRLMDPDNRVDEQFRFTGFWTPTRPSTLEPSPELVAFLQAGPPPVVFTLGSMVLRDPDRVAQAISEALRLAGERGVVVTGWADALKAARWSGRVLCVNVAPYDWLFPRASCVIHHGGPGTFQYVLRAGKVSICLPQTKGQELSALALERAGIATASLEISTLHPPDLAAAIRRALTDGQFQQNALAWQEIITADLGVRGAADLIEQHWQDLHPHRARPAEPAAPPRRGGKPRLLFLLSKDFGELHNALYFATEPDFDSLILATPSMYALQREGLPVPIAPYQSLDDVLDAVERFQPDLVFLFSGYLYAANGIFPNDDLETLLGALRRRGCGAVTSDSFFGRRAQLDDATFQMWTHLKERRTLELARAYDLLQSVPHLYDVDPGEFAVAEAYSFSNVRMVRPPAYMPCPPEVRRALGLDPARPVWLFVLAGEDYEALLDTPGLSFDDVLTDQLCEAAYQGRQPVLVAPSRCTSAVALRSTPSDGLTLVPFCRHAHFLSLVLDAEYAFFWNLFSNSVVARAVNRLPTFFFDQGHMARHCVGLFERYLKCYFTAGCPPCLPMDEPLDAEQLPRRAAAQADAMNALADNLLKSPPPAEVVRRLLRKLDAGGQPAHRAAR